MTLHVHIMNEPAPEPRSLLESRVPSDVRLTFGEQAPGTPFHVLVAGRPTRELLQASDRLRTLIIPWAGLPAPAAKLLADFPGVSAHNLHHNAAATAELAIALLLAVAKSLPRAHEKLRCGDWRMRFEYGHALQLEGRRALVLGMGAIGGRVARACVGLGMDVHGISRSGSSVDPAINVSAPKRLHEVLPTADALLVCLPATPKTTGLVGREEIGLLPPDAIVVNVARGTVVDEAALYGALREGRLFGAGLDVWWRYPGPEDDRGCLEPSTLPFHELPNVVFSPHRGGHVKDTELRRMSELADLIRAAAEGREIPNRVDRERGY